MNLVGKIFTVLILLMSMFFMGLAVAVYSAHKNWREVVENPEASGGKDLGLKFQLENNRARNQELKDQLDKLDGELAAEKAAKRQALSKLENENSELKGERDELTREHAKLKQAEREAVVAMQATQETLAGLRTEVEGLREKISKAQADRDAHFKSVVALTDNLHQAVNELKRLKGRQVTLADDLAKAKTVLQHNGLTVHTPTTNTPPQVDGLVLATTGDGLVEISIGEDDGLLKGHSLQVYRIAGGVSTYLGRIAVVRTSPDRSVCKIDPNYRKGTIQRGDRVASKLN